jgi:hypothetical protein
MATRHEILKIVQLYGKDVPKLYEEVRNTRQNKVMNPHMPTKGLIPDDFRK